MDEHLRILERTWKIQSGDMLPPQLQLPDFLRPDA